MTMQADQIDHLAAFCGLEDTGYTRDTDGYWVQDRPGLDRFAWRPDESDDDCRVVLERFYEVATTHQKIDFYQPFFDDDVDELYMFTERILLATPAEKCLAVLKVLEANLGD